MEVVRERRWVWAVFEVRRKGGGRGCVVVVRWERKRQEGFGRGGVGWGMNDGCGFGIGLF